MAAAVSITGQAGGVHSIGAEQALLLRKDLALAHLVRANL